MNTIAMVIIPIYLLIITGIILYTGRQVKTFKDYALAGGKLPWYVITGTILATFVGGGTLIGYVGSFYQHGLQWGWMCVGLFGSHLVMTYLLSERIRRLGQYTIADIFYLRYGRSSRLIAGVINAVVGVAVGFAMLASFASLLTGYLGVQKSLAMIIGAALFALTATMGGLVGVAYTDAIQAVIIIGGVIITGVVAFFKAGGSSGLATLPAQLRTPVVAGIPLMSFAGSVISAVGMGLADQATMFQRINAAQSPKDARKATLYFSWTCLFMFCLIAIIGLSARVILGEGFGGNAVLPELLKTVNPIIGGFYTAAIISAVLTTANSMYLSASMTISRDIVQEIWPEVKDEQMLVISKSFIWIMAIVSFFVVNYQPSIMRWILLGYACITCMIIPLYGGLLWKKATPASGTWSLALSIIAVLGWELAGSPGGVNSVLIALLVGAIGFVAGAYNKKGVTQEQIELVDIFKAKISVEESD